MEAKAAKERRAIDKTAKREARKQARLQQEADTKATNQESRAFSTLMRQGAELEKREERGGFAIVPTEGPSTVICIKEHSLKIKIGGKKAEEVRRKLDTLQRLAMPAAPSKRAVASQGRAAAGTSAAEANPYGKAFNVRERRGTRAAFAVAGVPPLVLTPALPPLPLLPNAAAGPFSAAAAAKAGDFAPPMPAPPSAAGEL